MSEAQIDSPPATDQESENDKIINITENVDVEMKVKEETTADGPVDQPKPQQNEDPSGDVSEEKAQATDAKDQLIEVTSKEGKKEGDKEVQKDQNGIVSDQNETTDNKNNETEEKCQTNQTTIIEKPENTASVGTSTVPVTETPEVSSTKNDEPPRNIRSSRRASYNSGRNYGAGYGYQNYGLTYLPYKSNFEPSEDARRKADEFFKTLKL